MLAGRGVLNMSRTVASHSAHTIVSISGEHALLEGDATT